MNARRRSVCVLVVGAGLMGTSLALALRRAGHEVHLTDLDPDVVRRAEKRAHVPSWTRGDRSDVDARIRAAFVAVPPSSTGSVMAEILSLNAEVIVSDLCSVKARPLAEVEASGSDLTRVVGGHPVAGREIPGPEGAVEGLFEDRPWVLCPGETTGDRALHLVDRLVRDCGAVPVVMSALEHDRVLATVSHMPQVVASVVASALLGLDDQDLRLAGPGVRDVTRIAASSPRLWEEILAANADAVRSVLTTVARDLELVATAPAADFARLAHDLVARGNAGRALLPEKGHRPVHWRWLWVPLPDVPGELGRLFMATGAAGVNIEDLRVRHADSGRSGWALLAVDRGRATHLARVLADGGWQVEVHDDVESDAFR